jgi:hypothetical protein
VPKIDTEPLLRLTSELTMPISVDLPAPLGTEQGEEVARLHVERDALERLDLVVVGLAQVAHRQRGGGGGRGRFSHGGTHGETA